MNNYCVDLNLPKPFANEEYALAHLKEKFKSTNHIVVTDLVNPEITEILEQHGLQLALLEAIYVKPGQTTFIHSDGTFLGDLPKINWIYGGVPSVMNWYTVNSGVTREPEDNPISTGRLRYETSEVTKVHTQQVKFPSLVQAGTPHNISNGSNHRYCVSMVFKTVGKQFARPSFDNTLLLLGKYIKE